MGHTMASWKILEDLMITLKRKNIEIPAKVVEDLRAAKSTIQLTCMEGSRGEAMQKAEEYSANVEAFLINEAEKIMEPQVVNDWLKRLEQANTEVCEGRTSGREQICCRGA